MDALEFLQQQHEETEAAFAEYEALGAGDAERRKEVARQVIADLSIHAAIEEIAFYPTVRDAMPQLDDEIEEDLREHQRVKELLARLEGTDPTSAEFDRTFRAVVADVRHHVEEEENDLFPQVRQALTEGELRDLGQALEQLQSTAPTRPHPHAPNEPPANVVAGPVAAALDRVRDAIRDRVGKDTV